MSQAELSHVRELARKVAEVAARPEMEQRRRDWYRHNALQPGKPMVYASPEGSWVELLPAESLVCETQPYRSWEADLRTRLYIWEHFADDEVVDERLAVGKAVRTTGWGLAPDYHHSDTSRGAYVWEAPLQDPADLDKLQFPTVEVDEEASARALEQAQEALGDLLRVEQRNSHWWTLGLIGELAQLRGLEQILLDMIERPRFVHEAMTFLLEGRMRWLDQLERCNLLSLNNGNDYVGSGGFGFTTELPAPDFDGVHVRCQDLWGFAENQEASTCSPRMFREFILDYQIKLLSRFGLNCHTCCEPIHDRFEHILLVPRLRRVSISPWCDLRIAAETLGDRFIFSWKPNPARLAGQGFDEDLVRREVRETLAAARGCIVEIVMKDTHTVRHQPWRYDRWAQIAQEEAQRAAE